MKKTFAAMLIVGAAAVFAASGEPDGLTLPAGFHATVVAEGLGPVRHLAVRGNGDLYLSTPHNQDAGKGGIIALHLDGSHHADQIRHFGAIDGGTGIRFHDDHLYASTPSGVYRFAFHGAELVPSGEPEVIVDGMPASHPGFLRVNRPIAFDAAGHLFVALDASANLCTAQAQPPPGQPLPTTPPVGLKPCPDLGSRAGVWRFDANKPAQKFPADGARWATGIRDIGALDWSPADKQLYGIMHARDNSHRLWPGLVSDDDDNHIADEMHRITKGTDFGWPYTYFDGAKNVRLISPEYGGDGKASPPRGTYSSPVLTFHSRRPAPVDMLFYSGSAFPPAYRHGAFVVLHGTQRSGYDVVFVPFDRNGNAGSMSVFADGFAGFDPASTSRAAAAYRPIGIAEGPDGALYVADSQKGRVWRIAYQADEPVRLISLSHFIHATGHLETTLAFYKTVFDFDAPAPRANSNPGVALLNNRPGIGLRASTPKFPGETFGIEMTDFSNVDKKGGQARATDPGGIELILPVRDLDAVVAAAKKAGAAIVTRSGAPVTVETPSGRTRAIVFRDNDGFMIRAVEAPATVPGMVQPGASMEVAVRDLTETAKFYHEVVGIDLAGDAKWVHDSAMADLAGAPEKSQYRTMGFAFPGTKSARMEFYEWKGLPRTPFHLRVPDPGASGWVARVSNIDAMMKQVDARHTPKLTPEPVWFTKTISDIFITDPNGMNLELFENVPTPKAAN